MERKRWTLGERIVDGTIVDRQKRERDKTRVSRVENQGWSPFGERKKRVGRSSRGCWFSVRRFLAFQGFI